MDAEQEQQHLTTRIQDNRDRRRRLYTEGGQLGAEIGADATLLRDRYRVSRAEQARLAGLPPATLGDLMSRAATSNAKYVAALAGT